MYDPISLKGPRFATLGENPSPAPTKALHFDEGKIRYDLIPPEFHEYTAKILAYGAEKYDEWNWTKGGDHQKYIASALRHIMEHRKGNFIDSESGLPHMWHAICDLQIVAYWVDYELGENAIPEYRREHEL